MTSLPPRPPLSPRVRSRPRTRAGGRRAFTLIEVLCVLGVLAAVTALVAPRLAASLGRGRLETQARTAVALCRKARALATAEGRSYSVIVDETLGEMRLVRRRDPLAPALDEEDPEREVVVDASWARPVPFEEDVRVVEATVDGEATGGAAGLETAIAFAPDGSAVPATLVLEGPGADRLVVVVDGPIGLARIEPVEDDEVTP